MYDGAQMTINQMQRPMPPVRPSQDDDDCVSAAFRYLLRTRGVTVKRVADETGISENTLYALKSRRCNRADMRLLKRLADYFGEDLEIFCGLDQYAGRRRLGPDEQRLLDNYTSLTDAARRRILEMMADMVENPKNRRR